MSITSISMEEYLAAMAARVGRALTSDEIAVAMREEIHRRNLSYIAALKLAADFPVERGILK